ncbi:MULTISPECIES: ABC transporter ATP-binding protein [unclassified Cyanobium]|uniref:ABC transporter ATP-binding protein n=1 Tax=unclassified Cyanobium TaxID=2627006 RepID=UPI0020CC2C24|nr:MULTISPECIES: ABC transporter ATP-binding protein [unclassified Cyanobium]MCP9776974.1 ABC transporter ATP-binding protein [Cyanobium sp. Tous-M-B4]MCP9875240.1 ABC transporter ATP-binding protein [Cyanobium sp. A2C-AMD]
MSDSDVVIRVEGLGKKYSLHHEQGERYTALRDVVARQAKAAGRLLNPFTLAGQLRKAQRQAAKERSESEEEFWALKDVSFEIRRGERVGIIGRNGAGKSTLLKILSRITEPSTGRVEILGRVASLLEVGTGFHPELTGRENIYLNGAILGMMRREIRAKFDKIVDFAEVEKFLDTPVKRYSSGMYVRLAFAVAAYLEPEILVVDEVLAVGDASFQKKCLGKMKDVSGEGRTVLFVSHSMGVLGELCSKGIWLNEGKIQYLGSSVDCIQKYLSSGYERGAGFVDLSNHKNRIRGAKNILISAALFGKDKTPNRDFKQNECLKLRIKYQASEADSLAGAGFIVKTTEGIRVGGFNTYMAFQPPHNIPSSGEVEFRIECNQLTPGQYVLTVSLGSHQGTLADKVEDCIDFSIMQSDIYKTGYLLTKEDGVAALRAEAVVSSLSHVDIVK